MALGEGGAPGVEPAVDEGEAGGGAGREEPTGPGTGPVENSLLDPDSDSDPDPDLNLRPVALPEPPEPNPAPDPTPGAALAHLLAPPPNASAGASAGASADGDNPNECSNDRRGRWAGDDRGASEPVPDSASASASVPILVLGPGLGDTLGDVTPKVCVGMYAAAQAREPVPGGRRSMSSFLLYELAR